jgi:putative DNA methylase
MLTWGAFNVVGATNAYRRELKQAQEDVAAAVQAQIDALRIETDNSGWTPKTFLYCLEVVCPQTEWKVPLLPTRLISQGRATIAELVPDPMRKRYDIVIRSGATEEQLARAVQGTVDREARFSDAYFTHQIDGVDYKTKISTLRGDYEKPDGTTGNLVRLWEKREFKARSDDIFQERLYCVQWIRPKKNGKGYEHEFRTVTCADLERERIVEAFIEKHLADWQAKGWLPDMRIEPGGPPRYEGLSLIRGRGWTHWNHLFAPRQLMFLGLTSQSIRAQSDRFVAPLLIFLARLADWSSKLCRYGTGAARESVAQTFYNQALNTLFAYGVRSFSFAKTYLLEDVVESPIASLAEVMAKSAVDWNTPADLFVTDPPYGDAVKYEEILDFFIAWLRKNPPQEFADWTWDSRRSLAIKGEDENFRRNMVAAYKRITECMSANGIQVIMFTHQSGSIWADMANIVWASGLQVTAAWYVVTETDTALREGSYVKGTVLLVVRKRIAMNKTTRDDLGWEIQEEVEKQVHTLTGLNQETRGLYRDENVFEDADIQMAGYAAALRALTRYAIIDGRDMTVEAIRPRVKGETTFVDGLIAFAVDTANQCLVPQGIPEKHWKEFSSAERFYLKLIDLESKGLKTLDNYQNFAKAFKVRDFRALMGSQKANAARLKSAVEFGRGEMGEGSQLHESALRAVLYAMMELVKDVDGNEVLGHLTFNVPEYYSDGTQRERVVELADYLAKKLETLRPEEASAARVLREMARNQRLG